MSETAQVLQAAERGEPKAAAGLLPLVYDELRKLAAARMAQEVLALRIPQSALKCCGSIVLTLPGCCVTHVL